MAKKLGLSTEQIVEMARTMTHREIAQELGCSLFTVHHHLRQARPFNKDKERNMDFDLGERLKGLRETRKLSQGDIEQRTGMLRCYVSRVENNHTVPSVQTLEKWAKALGIELYQLFYSGDGKPVPEKVAPPSTRGVGAELTDIFRRLSPEARSALLRIARLLDRTKNGRG